MERYRTSVLLIKWGNHCNSELCEKWPFVTLNQRTLLLIPRDQKRLRLPPAPKMPWTDVIARALDTTRYEHSTLCCGLHLQYQLSITCLFIDLRGATYFHDRDPVERNVGALISSCHSLPSRASNRPRLKRAVQTVTTEDARLRPIDTIPLRLCHISFLPL